MNDRTPLFLALIAILVAVAAYINMDLVVPDPEYPSGVLNTLTWQGEEEQRSLHLRRGLDLQGGLQVLLQADASGGGEFDTSDLQAAATIIQNRVDALGVTEPLVQTQGEDKIVVELPGVQDPDLAVRTIGKTALLEFIYSGSNGVAEGDTVVTTEPVLFHELPEDKQKPHIGDAPETGATEEITGTEGLPTVYPSVITGEYLADASVGVGSLTNEFLVNFQLNSEAARWMDDFTRERIGEFMPIVLDKEIISSPVLQGNIAGQGQITGDFTRAEAESLVVQLKSGSLPVPLEIVGQTRIGPTLGAESVDLAVKGGLVGMAIVMIFMLAYYRLPGLLADVALVIYVLLALAVFRLLPVTLTLAGIAGFILSIGMAVDANILIFERMKEELRSGKRLRAAMDTGFSRAWPSIRDSNFSTLITCAILFWFGSQFGASIVKGFAVTLAVGVLTSLFTAITVTRTFLKASNRIVFSDAAAVSPQENPRMRALLGF